MNRGEALQWGFEIDTDGKQWNVTVHGSQRPDFTFGDIEAFIEWLREENEGVQIARMAKRPPLTPEQRQQLASVFYPERSDFTSPEGAPDFTPVSTFDPGLAAKIANSTGDDNG